MPKRQEDRGNYKLLRKIESVMHGQLFHLTDMANADSIKQRGILSRCEAAALSVAPVRPGGNALTRALDAQRGLEDYVFLGFQESGLMPKNEELDRDREPLMLFIDPEIVLQHSVKVSLGRSIRSPVLKASHAFYEMDWDILEIPELRSDLSPGIYGPARWNAFLDYEVLVPKSVPLELIIGSEPVA